MRNGVHITPSERAHIRKLRYQDGLTRTQVAAITGRSVDTITRQAPAQPRGVRVPNAPIAQAAIDATETGQITWSDIAKHVDMTCTPGPRNRNRRGDTSRLKRHLGILPSSNNHNGRRTHSYQPTISAALAARICEILGLDVDELCADITSTRSGGPCPECGIAMRTPAPMCGFCVAEIEQVAA